MLRDDQALCKELAGEVFVDRTSQILRRVAVLEQKVIELEIKLMELEEKKLAVAVAVAVAEPVAGPETPEGPKQENKSKRGKE
jgi:hypothetical protein